jgi:quinol monooxygenase YgiN
VLIVTGSARIRPENLTEAIALCLEHVLRSRAEPGCNSHAVTPGRRGSLPIRRFAEKANNIVHWSEFDRDGHFAAMEVPDLLVADVREFFPPVR